MEMPFAIIGSAVDLSRWTRIAVQAMTARGLRWAKLEGAPMTLAEAKAMYRAGRQLKALRREGEATYVVVNGRNRRLPYDMQILKIRDARRGSGARPS